MAIADISRDAFDPRKQYRAVLLQQGRVLTDDDANEAERIRLEDERRARLEIVGPYGSPNDGFRVDEPRVSEAGIDFEIRPGSLYVGGRRVERLEGETYRRQRDWLTAPLDPGAPGGIEAPDGERFDLVYLETWHQPVSAVEDREIAESALGAGPGHLRLRSMSRVKVHPDVGTAKIRPAWEQLVREWTRAGRGRLNGEYELVPDTRLRVEPDPEASRAAPTNAQSDRTRLDEAPCRTLYVELLEDRRVMWGFHESMTLVRARLADGTGDRLTLGAATAPLHHAPEPGQVVELVPWGAVLVNHEPVADDLEPGFFAFVEDFDSDSRTLQLHRPASTGFLERARRWRQRRDAEELARAGFAQEDATDGAEGAPVFLRLWDQGGVPDQKRHDGRGEVPGVPLDDEGRATLSGTGLAVRLVGSGGGRADHRPGDYWIVSTNLRTVDQGRRVGKAAGVLPPQGPRRFYAPLAVIHWNGGEHPDEHPVYDGRPTFRPLVSPSAD